MMIPSVYLAVFCVIIFCFYSTETASNGKKAVYLDIDHVNVEYVNEKYFAMFQFVTRRKSRSDQVHYFRVTFDLLQPAENDDTYHYITFYELLSNRYKPSFIVLKWKLCDGIETYLRFAIAAYNKIPLKDRPMPTLKCPFLPGLYNFTDMKLSSATIPQTFPFPEGRIYYNVTHKKNVIFRLSVDFQLKTED